MDLAPIVLFTFNRLDHTMKTIEALKNNNLAKESNLYIFSDGPRNEDEKVKVDEVRKYLNNIIGFKNITIIESLVNKGLAQSVITGVSDIINQYGNVIVLEDDLVTSQFFLEYMNKALKLYQHRKDIWSISGYSPEIAFPKEYQDEVYLIMRGASWGWATWKDRWGLNDWDITDYEEFKYNKKEIKKLNLAGSDMGPMLNDQMEGRINSWAIRWGYNQFRQNMWTVYPVKSFVKNIGTDLSGTHSNMTNKFDVELENKTLTINPEVIPCAEIMMAFKRKYDLSILGQLARVIKKMGLYKPARVIRNKVIVFTNKIKT